MNPVNLLMLLTLASLWGGSFLFMRIAGPVLGPFMTIELRVGIAAVALFLYATLVRHRLNIRHKWKEFLVIGAINAAIPFVLITTAELSLSSSLASILNATTPIFTAIIARFWLNEKFGPQKTLGLVAGVVGVVILVGWDPVPLNAKLLLSVAYSLVAAFSYGVAGIFSAKYLRGIKPIDLAIGQQTAATILLIPFAASHQPVAAPAATVIYAVLGLALLSTACGYLLYFRLINNVGPVKTLSVTFLVPIFGVLWGHLFLDEAVHVNTLVGMLVILASIMLVTNVMPLRRRSLS